MKKPINLKKIQLILAATAIVLLLILVCRICIAGDAAIVNTRSAETYQQISSASYQEISDKSAPLGVVKRYRFTLDADMCRGSHLSFYTVHQYVDVFVGEERIYSLQPNPKTGIKTTGSNNVVGGLN